MLRTISFTLLCVGSQGFGKKPRDPEHRGVDDVEIHGYERLFRAVSDHAQLGVRPYYLVRQMKEGDLKDELVECAAKTKDFRKTSFSIGHRGAALQFPEHTLESYEAAAIQGAGVIECDVTFTKDRKLVCRHDQCDLHTTTDVVTRPELNAKCSTPWAPGVEPQCCTSDFTLDEVKTLCAKMDSGGTAESQTAEEYAFGHTPDWRTDLYQNSCPRIPTHKEYIEFVGAYGAMYTPELKAPHVAMPYEGEYTQEMYAQHMIDEYVEAGVPPARVWPQSFLWEDVYYWIQHTDYGAQAVALDEELRNEEAIDTALDQLVYYHVNIVAPPLWMLVEADGDKIVPSYYAKAAKKRGLDIITWTLERSPPGLIDWYWQSLNEAGYELTDGDLFTLLNVLAFDVGVLGVFSDWPATVTFFANCMHLH